MHPFIHLSILFWLKNALHCRSNMSSNCLIFHTSGGISSSPAVFLFLIFLRTESSSSLMNGPSLMSNCLMIILVIGSCVTFGAFRMYFFARACAHTLTHTSKFEVDGQYIYCKSLFVWSIWKSQTKAIFYRYFSLCKYCSKRITSKQLNSSNSSKIFVQNNFKKIYTKMSREIF